MRRLLFLCLCLAVSSAFARTVDPEKSRPVKRNDPVISNDNLAHPGVFSRAAQYDTTFLAVYTWDQGASCVTEGWISQDRTLQTHDFWHVAGPAELDGGAFGRLVPLEGAQSMWCGAAGPVSAATDRVLCNYATLPGYGNNWDQSLCLKECLSDAGGVVINAAVSWDSEASYEAAELQISSCGGNWIGIYGGLFIWDGHGSDTISVVVPDSLHNGNLGIRFHFESDGIYSDEDGLWDSDGAFLIDQLSVTDTSGVRVAYEDFEDEIAGTHEADDWISCPPEGYGDFAGLYPGHSLVQEDPCVSRLDCMWGFINGSMVDYGCGGWPTQNAVPYVNTNDQYIHNYVYSPDIAVVGAGSIWRFSFDVYRDLPLDGLVFYLWRVRSIDSYGCPGKWRSDNFVHYGSQKDWRRATVNVGQLIEPGATHVAVSVGVRDMCQYWCGIYYTSWCHSHAPLFANAEVYRINHSGPAWTLNDIDMFQDNFSEDGSLTGTSRADMAMDILPYSSAGILPGDSVALAVTDPEAGLGFHVPGDTSSGAAVYLFCRIDGPSSGKTGGDLVTDSRYNYTGTASANGDSWFRIQVDSTWSDGTLVENRYNVDLNDNLFVPGDTVWFFFGARNAIGNWSYTSLFLPNPTFGTADIGKAAAAADEFTILPASPTPSGDLLYVDGMNLRGAQPYFEQAFIWSGYQGQIDRYDIRGPSSDVGNHPGSRVKNAAVQLAGVYRNIVWNTGDLHAFADGSGNFDKSDDTGMLYTWLENLTGPGGGVYLNGDDAASHWINRLSSASATQLRTKYCDFFLNGDSHASVVGVSPYGVGVVGGMFDVKWPSPHPDTLTVFGGCPGINDFDVFMPAGTANLEMSYHGNGNTAGAIVSDTTTNPVGNQVGFVLSGFSFHEIRDAFPFFPGARPKHMNRILFWLGNILDIVEPVPGVSVTRNDLGQNYPNPFNPVTTIKYQVKTDGPVTLKVYNVAGQLVRTLVNESVRAGVIHEVQWKGLNDKGSRVSSGVYFYRLVAADYTQTKKMVVLK